MLFDFPKGCELIKLREKETKIVEVSEVDSLWTCYRRNFRGKPFIEITGSALEVQEAVKNFSFISKRDFNGFYGGILISYRDHFTMNQTHLIQVRVLKVNDGPIVRIPKRSYETKEDITMQIRGIVVRDVDLKETYGKLIRVISNIEKLFNHLMR